MSQDAKSSNSRDCHRHFINRNSSGDIDWNDPLPDDAGAVAASFAVAAIDRVMECTVISPAYKLYDISVI